jgi:5-methylcytosine-specific restriction endonuclease McrA
MKYKAWYEYEKKKPLVRKRKKKKRKTRRKKKSEAAAIKRKSQVLAQHKKVWKGDKKWMNLRYDTLSKNRLAHGGMHQCELCETNKGPFEVDHVKPKVKYPELKYDPENLQVLCAMCNQGKGVRHEHDWRSK